MFSTIIVLKIKKISKRDFGELSTLKSFPLRISSVNATKSPENYGFDHIYRRNPE